MLLFFSNVYTVTVSKSNGNQTVTTSLQLRTVETDLADNKIYTPSNNGLQ